MTNDKIAIALAEIAEMGRAWENARDSKPSLANKLASVIADRCRDASELAKRHGVQLAAYSGDYIQAVMEQIGAGRKQALAAAKTGGGITIRTMTRVVDEPQQPLQQPEQRVDIDFGDEFGILPT